MMAGLGRTRAPLLAAVAIVLLLAGILCLFDDDGAGVDSCVVFLAVASGSLVALALEPSGALALVRPGNRHPLRSDPHSPPPKGSLAVA